MVIPPLTVLTNGTHVLGLLLRAVSSPYILALPRKNVLIPILLPTSYLWIIDTLALRRGTWEIAKDTTTGLYLWPNLELE